MPFTFRPATRQQTPLIIGISGPTKAGKSLSSLRLATGLAGGKPIAMLNTEGPRGQMYSDRVQYVTADMDAPFRYTRYIEALKAMKQLDLGCAIIDSASHGHDGPGGTLEWHEEILDRVAGRDYAKRERSTFVAWIEPKAAESQFIYALQEFTCPVILCMRAKEKIKISKGTVEELGWQPIVGERVAFETMFTLMLRPHAKGVPDLSISDMREPFDQMILPGVPIDEALGERLAAWAHGGSTRISASPPTQSHGSAARAPERQPGHPSRPQLTRLFTLKQAHQVSDEALRAQLQAYGVESTKELSLDQYQALCTWLESSAGEDVKDPLVRSVEPALPSEQAWETLHARARALGLSEIEWEFQRANRDIGTVETLITTAEQAQPQRELA